MSVIKHEFPRLTLLLAVLGFALVFTPGMAQEEFAWMPKSGSELLLETLEACEGCDDLETILTAERGQSEWREYFAAHEEVMEARSEQELETLATYLALTAPLEPDAVPDPDAGAYDLPTDGKLIALQQCMICHGIHTSLTLDWNRERWLSLLDGGAHGSIEMSERSRELLTRYLARHTLSLDEIPEEYVGPDPGQ